MNQKLTNFPILESNRLLLKRITLEDSHSIFSIYSDIEAMKYMQRNAIKIIAEADNLINRWNASYQESNAFRWGVFLKNKPNKLIGTVALHYWNKGSNSIELGADLIKEEWGKGYAKEFTSLIIEYAFNVLNINRLELRCDPRNLASVKIAEKFAFTYEGTLREYVFVEGKGYLDESVYSLLFREYKSK